MGGTKADWSQYLASLDRLASWSVDGRPVRFDLLLPGHGTVDLDQGHRSVERTGLIVREIIARRSSGEKLSLINEYRWAWRNRAIRP